MRRVMAPTSRWGDAWARPLLAAAFLVAALLPAQAQAAKLCGWFAETVDSDQTHNVQLWLQSDAHVWFLYRIAGKGFYSGDNGVEDNSPGGTTYSVDPGPPNSAWSEGQSAGPGDHIDIVVEIREWPKDLTDDTVRSPLLGQFVYRRTVKAGEKRSMTSPHTCFEATFPDN